ncbi:hypothetical protein [Streptantibioticus ferralitis]|uniref:Uncharacterized protein n=1 Tax=Streptantibioticus ferralitis TaxID=236510 RepID=A0ABT5YWZ8_9ACTN|nr:hypothetical protein [Streptantibioticus ferralitis]MDF2255841.1 hypothetical protein [Streptantibioticus ferralitis]
MIGNPPWDKVDFEDKKYFSVVVPSIAESSGTARRTRIAEWEEENPEAGKRGRAERRKVKSTFLFAGSSGAFPLCRKGLTVKGVNSLQTDQLFAERFASIAAPKGRFGCIIPTRGGSSTGMCSCGTVSGCCRCTRGRWHTSSIFQSDSGGGLKNNENAKYGTNRTKDLVLAEYDRMALLGVSLDTPLVDAENYTSTLTPPPGHGPRHPARPETA